MNDFTRLLLKEALHLVADKAEPYVVGMAISKLPESLQGPVAQFHEGIKPVLSGLVKTAEGKI